MNSGRLVKGMTVCVTGASSGMGRAISEHLGSLGAHVFMMGRTAEPMELSADKIRTAGGHADISVFDLQDLDALAAWIKGAANSTGHLDVMVNNAGRGDVHGARIADGNPAIWKEMLEINVLALTVGCQAAIQAMRATESNGNIINISSVAGIRRESGVYGATKHAVNCINASLRQELEDDTIRVTSIMPGVFATNFGRNIDRPTMEGVAAMAGIVQPTFDSESRMPREQLAQIQQLMSTTMGNELQIAQAVEYVITQSIDLNIEELVIRPAKSLF